jgi:acetyl-CoA decarbonylase/synthase complex subunit gamma
MANLAIQYECPITLFVNNDLEKMKELSRTLRAKGIKDIVLDPSTYVGNGIGDTIDNFVMIRRLAVEENDEDFRFPIIGVPAVTWLYEKDDVQGGIKEATIAATLMNKYADILIVHGTNIWELIPMLTLRQSLYTDPRKPQAVDPGLYEFGEVDENSPVLLTTNFALTYYTVEGDLKSGKGNQFNGKSVTDIIKHSKIEDKVKTRTLIVPGLAASISGEIEDESGWEVLVGPRDSSAVADFLLKLKNKG